jgi:hypothetical protein
MDLILGASRSTGWPGMTGTPLPMLAISDATMASTGRGTSTENATENGTDLAEVLMASMKSPGPPGKMGRGKSLTVITEAASLPAGRL